MKRYEIPIIIGKGKKKGLFGFRNRIFGGSGYDLAIVRLKRQYESGEPFDLSDMDGPEVIMHFCDRESLQLTADVLNRILAGWKENDEEDNRHGRHERLGKARGGAGVQEGSA